MNKCGNCIKINDCKDNAFLPGCCDAYSPIRVTNKERFSIKSYEEAAIMLSDFYHSIKDSDNVGSLVLGWLQSN